MDFDFIPYNFVENLRYMGIGMLGVFMIVGVIMIATYLISYVTGRIGKSKGFSTNSKETK